MKCVVCSKECEMGEAYVLPTLLQTDPNKAPEQPVACSPDCRDNWFRQRGEVPPAEAFAAIKDARETIGRGEIPLAESLATLRRISERYAFAEAA